MLKTSHIPTGQCLSLATKSKANQAVQSVTALLLIPQTPQWMVCSKRAVQLKYHTFTWDTLSNSYIYCIKLCLNCTVTVCSTFNAIQMRLISLQKLKIWTKVWSECLNLSKQFFDFHSQHLKPQRYVLLFTSLILQYSKADVPWHVCFLWNSLPSYLRPFLLFKNNKHWFICSVRSSRALIKTQPHSHALRQDGIPEPLQWNSSLPINTSHFFTLLCVLYGC